MGSVDDFLFEISVLTMLVYFLQFTLCVCVCYRSLVLSSSWRAPLSTRLGLSCVTCCCFATTPSWASFWVRQNCLSHVQIICSISKVSYCVFLCHLICPLGTGEGDVVDAEKLLQPYLIKYPKVRTWLFFS